MERYYANIIYKYPTQWRHVFLSETELMHYGELLAGGIKQLVPADLIEIYFNEHNQPKLFYSSIAASDKRTNKISQRLAGYVALSQEAFRFPYYNKEKYPDIKYSDVLELGKSFIALPLFYNHECVGTVNIASATPQVFRDDIVPHLYTYISQWDVLYKSLLAKREIISTALQTLDYFNSITHPVFAVQKDCKLVYRNDAFMQFILEHYKRHYEQDITALDQLVGHDFPEMELLMQEAWRNGEASIEKNYLVAGKELWFGIDAYKLHDNVLFIYRLLKKPVALSVRDEHSYQILYEQLPFVVLLTDRNSEILFHNNYLTKILGREIKGSSLLEFIDTSEIKKYFRLITDALHSDLQDIPMTLTLQIDKNKSSSFSGYLKRINYRNDNALVFFGTDILREGALMNNYLSISPKDVFEMIPIGIAVLNEQLNTTYINSVFTEITRYELSELPGLPLTDILFELDQANQLMPQIVALATGDSIHRIIQLESKYHEYKSVLLTISPYTNNEDRGYILSVYDITELEKEKKHIQEQAQIAVDAQIAEEQFLARMSHEIRTAMNGIIGLTNVMIQSGLSGEQRQFLNLIKQSTDNLLVIINDILDLSKIKSGKMQFEEVPVQLKVLFENLYSIVLSKLGAKEIHLKLDFDQDIPTQLNTDPTRINQILLNLLGNAIKFTDRGQITYSAKLLGKQDDKARILIEVSDTGIGIDDKNIDLIFDSYKQAESDTTRKYGGTGLGLPIVKQLVELMGGHISVRSALNKGTTFSIELPLTISEEQIVQDETESKGPDIPEGIRVLVVDDNYINRLLVVHLLKAKGFDVLEASGGYEALDILQEEDIDLILMDISMPVIDGFETTRIIRKSDKAYIRQIPVIAMTAHGFQDQIRNARDAGMDNYIVKPFKPEQLYQLIIDQLEITKGPSENEDKLDQSDKINQQIHHTPKRNYNLAFLEDYYDHEPGFINNILKLYVQDTPEMLQEMTACISNNDWKQFKALAHKIKTNIMMMGIEPVDEFFKASSAMDPLDTGQASIRLMFQAFKQIVKDALEQIIADRKLNS